MRSASAQALPRRFQRPTKPPASTLAYEGAPPFRVESSCLNFGGAGSSADQNGGRSQGRHAPSASASAAALHPLREMRPEAPKVLTGPPPADHTAGWALGIGIGAATVEGSVQGFGNGGGGRGSALEGGRTSSGRGSPCWAAASSTTSEGAAAEAAAEAAAAAAEEEAVEAAEAAEEAVGAPMAMGATAAVDGRRPRRLSTRASAHRRASGRRRCRCRGC